MISFVIFYSFQNIKEVLNVRILNINVFFIKILLGKNKLFADVYYMNTRNICKAFEEDAGKVQTVPNWFRIEMRRITF